jgi:hypothetical protein
MDDASSIGKGFDRSGSLAIAIEAISMPDLVVCDREEGLSSWNLTQRAYEYAAKLLELICLMEVPAAAGRSRSLTGVESPKKLLQRSRQLEIDIHDTIKPYLSVLNARSQCWQLSSGRKRD